MGGSSLGPGTTFQPCRTISRMDSIIAVPGNSGASNPSCPTFQIVRSPKLAFFTHKMEMKILNTCVVRLKINSCIN